MKKILVLAIVFIAVGLTVVSAQTRQQQQELEQIGRRSTNGITPQDRQRFIEIMTEVGMAEGMSRERATQWAEQMANAMYSGNVGNVTDQSDVARRVLEQEQQRQNQLEQDRRQAQVDEQRRMYPGDTRGWPTSAQLRGRGLSNLRQPAGTQSSYSGNPVETIYLTGANATIFQNLKRDIERIISRTFDDLGSGEWKASYGQGRGIDLEFHGDQIIISFWTSAG